MKSRIKFLQVSIIKTGKIFRDGLCKEKITIKEKTKNDFVTGVDEQIEKFLYDEISKYFPNDSFLGEEIISTSGLSDFKWIIDPIDGTNNYVRGIQDARIQAALLHDESIIFGCIYNPFSEELYIGAKNKGAKKIILTTNKKERLCVSRRKLSKSMVIYTAAIAKATKHVQKTFINLIDKIAHIRIYGTAALAIELIASGKADAFICNIAKPMDIAPGYLIIKEAGGKVVNFKGIDWKIGMKEVVICNSTNHKEIISLLKSINKS